MKATVKPITKKDLLVKLKGLEPIDDETKKSVTCSLIGHSLIMTTCFGYFYCGRCGDQVGDNLGSVFPTAEKSVVVGHNCDKCRENFAALTWKDKLFAPDPFAVEKEEGDEGI